MPPRASIVASMSRRLFAFLAVAVLVLVVLVLGDALFLFLHTGYSLAYGLVILVTLIGAILGRRGLADSPTGLTVLLVTILLVLVTVLLQRQSTPRKAFYQCYLEIHQGMTVAEVRTLLSDYTGQQTVDGGLSYWFASSRSNTDGIIIDFKEGMVSSVQFSWD